MISESVYDALVAVVNTVPGELEDARERATTVLAGVEAFEDEVDDTVATLDASLDGAHDAVQELSAQFEATRSQLDDTLASVFSELADVEDSLRQLQASLQEQAAEARAAAEQLGSQLATSAEAQSAARSELDRCLTGCKTSLAEQADAISGAMDTAQAWAREAQSGVVNARQELDAAESHLEGELQSASSSITAAWEESAHTLETASDGFASTLASLASHDMEEVLRQLRSELETKLQEQVNQLISDAVAQLRVAIAEMMQHLGEDTGLLQEARALFDELSHDLDGMLDELRDTARRVFDLGSQLGVG